MKVRLHCFKVFALRSIRVFSETFKEPTVMKESYYAESDFRIENVGYGISLLLPVISTLTQIGVLSNLP